MKRHPRSEGFDSVFEGLFTPAVAFGFAAPEHAVPGGFYLQRDIWFLPIM